MNLKRLAVLGAAVAFFAASPAWASLGDHQVDATNPCQKCHDTAKGTPTLRGWSGGSLPAFSVTGSWAGRTISSLCYMCHTSGGGGYSATNQSANAFNDGAHQNTAGDLSYSPAGAAEGTMGTLNLPYARGTNMECTTCHNVHKSEDKPFLQRASAAALCVLCHTGRTNATPLRGTANSVSGRSTHPTAVTVAANGNNISIKTLVDPGTNPGVNVAYGATTQYELGGHIVGGGTTGTMDCGTCHAVHGLRQGVGPVNDLLAIQNTTGANGNALCAACHNGGMSSGNVGTDNPGLGIGDHPIDTQTGGAFYPSPTTFPPAEWTGQRSRNVTATKSPQPMYGGITPACSSCHDMHGGLNQTALLQYGTTTTTFSYQTWCWLCHAAAAISPAGHHSNTLNWGTSQVVCGDCHGSAASGDSWTAHNGFWGFAAVPVSATNSAICEGCHTPTDPTFLVTTGLKGVAGSLTNPAAYPSTHGTLRSPNNTSDLGSSHQVDRVADATNPNLVHKTTAWASSGGSSEWGAGTNNPICESCHNILVNGAGTATATVTSGWLSNLLLQAYEDDAAGTVGGTGSAVGDALCRGCHTNGGNGFVHNPSAHTVPSGSYTYAASELPYGRSTSTIMTVAGTCPNSTTADGSASPGILSYPSANNVDCDSCHRPHNADADSDDAGRYLILENTAASAWGTTICAECHNTDTQCQ